MSAITDPLHREILASLTGEIREHGADTVTLPDVLAHNEHEGWTLDGETYTHLPDDAITRIYWQAVGAAEGLTDA